MSRPVIRVEGLGKQYTIGAREHGYQTFREMLMSGLSAPVKRLSKLRGRATEQERFWALKDVNFEVSEGEVVGIIGRNGAGKSTLLKILSRITAPTKGRIEIRGRVASLLEVGTGFHPELTGRENIYLNGAILGMTRREIDKKFDEMVAFAGVERFLDTPVKRYSSGMYVRLAFSVAAHLEPEILVIDEVLAVGDAEFQKKCLGKMGDVAGHGRTVLFVSHNMMAVNSLCPKTILLDKGSMALLGKTEHVIQSYLTDRGARSSENAPGVTVNSQIFEAQTRDDFRFCDIQVTNPSARSLGPRTGGPLLLQMQYSSDCDARSPAFVIQIKDSYGQELIRLSTMPISGYRIESLYRRGHVELLIDSLPLVAGQYFIDIGFVLERAEWISKLEEVVAFEVQPYDVYDSGFPLDRSRGMLVVNHSWVHQSLDAQTELLHQKTLA